MKTLVSLQAFLLILYFVGTNGRHADLNEDEDLPEGEEQTDLLNRMRDHATQTRHRRRPRQMYGYDYPRPLYYDNRKDYSISQQDEYLSRIVKSLDEIIDYLRRPLPSAPQPVYIPYPIWGYKPCLRPHPRPNQNHTVSTEDDAPVPNVPVRGFPIEDENQLWDSSILEYPEYEDGASDGSRPISFVPVKPNRPQSRPPPSVDHGSSQAGSGSTTSAPARRPGACETAILTCCSVQGRTSQRNCFARFDCSKTFATNRACHPDVIKRVLEHFTNAYAPVTTS